jgi:hypothetical protein
VNHHGHVWVVEVHLMANEAQYVVAAFTDEASAQQFAERRGPSHRVVRVPIDVADVDCYDGEDCSSARNS